MQQRCSSAINNLFNGINSAQSIYFSCLKEPCISLFILDKTLAPVSKNAPLLIVFKEFFALFLKK
jgi:hypothetical protein